MLFSRSLSLFCVICCSLHTKTNFSAHSSTQCTRQVNQTYKRHSYHVLDRTWKFCVRSNYVGYPQFQLNRRIFNDFFSGFALSLYEIFRLKQFQKFIYVPITCFWKTWSWNVIKSLDTCCLYCLMCNFQVTLKLEVAFIDQTEILADFWRLEFRVNFLR